MDKDQFNKLFQESIKNYATSNQYGVSSIPVHEHTGVDSPSISPANLTNASAYFVITQIVLSSTQIKNLNTTPVVIVPRQGVSSTNTNINSVLIIEGITAKIVYGGTAYTGANALEFRYGDASGAKVTADIPNTFINQTSTTYAHVSGVTTAQTPIANTPIIVRIPTANPSTGNSQITFVIKYRVVSI